MRSPVLSTLGTNNAALGATEVRDLVTRACPANEYHNKKVVLIVPDATRTAPVDLCFKALHDQIAGMTAAFDVMIALGTHQPMSEEAICERLEISLVQRRGHYRSVQFFNHEWDNPDALNSLGTIPSNEISELSGGLFAMDVPVDVNRRLFDYDQLIIIGPVFPHEVVGFSGGNKYLFPGVSGPEVLELLPLARRGGHESDDHRQQMDAGAQGRGSRRRDGERAEALLLHGRRQARTWPVCSSAAPKARGTEASDLSRKLHITLQRPPVLTPSSRARRRCMTSCGSAGKCMYKLEPVVADGGELIIYAPHIHEISVTHGQIIEEIGYHCRDYFLKQWDKFKDYPWGTLAHSHARARHRHVRKWRREMPREVTLATRHPDAKSARRSISAIAIRRFDRIRRLRRPRGRRRSARAARPARCSTSFGSPQHGPVVKSENDGKTVIPQRRRI